MADRLSHIAIHIEEFSLDFLSEELMVMSDDIRELEEEAVGTLSGLAKGLKEMEREYLEPPSPFSKILIENFFELLV